MARVSAQPPLPMLPAGAVEVGTAAGLVEGEAGGVVFVFGQATFAWAPGDEVARKVAAVQLVATRVARQVEVAAAFGVDAATVWRWQRAYEAEGLCGLLATKRGPKGPRKLTSELVARIAEMDADGATLQRIATATGVSTTTVRRALGRGAAPPAGNTDTAAETETETAVADVQADVQADIRAEVRAEVADETVADADPTAGGLPVLPAPVPRTGERALARTGLLAEAAPVFTEGAHLPLAGLLLALPGLAATGLLEAAEGVYGRLRNGFYGLRATLLMLVFLALVGEPRAEGASRIRPADLGRLLGLDRGPEVKTIRRKLAELAGYRRGVELLAALAGRHAATRPEALGFLYVDGHVRVYTGTRRLPKAHVARMRIAAPAMTETWVADADGDPVFVVTAPPAASLVAELRRLAPQLRALVGPDRRVTIVFDRGGYSPALFAELVATGFDLLTYRKGRFRREPATAFGPVTHTGDDGVEHGYLLADRNVRLRLPRGRKDGRNTVTMRQVTRRSADGHQTPILTTRTDLPAAEVAYRMGNRWRQENYFKYGRAHFALDALDGYAAVDDDPGRSVPNPAKNTARKKVSQARTALARTEAALAAAVDQAGRTARDGGSATVDPAVADAVQAARAALAAAQVAAAATPARVPLAHVDPDARLLDEERKLLTHAVRISAYNAESVLARLLRPHYARADDEARALLREAFTLSGDIQIASDRLHVRLDPASAPRRSRALAALAAALTTTETLYPGTQLKLVYTVKGFPNPA